MDDADTFRVSDENLIAGLAAVLAEEDREELRWRALGEINNRLVSRFDPDLLADWWRTPNDELDGCVPEDITSGEFDPADPMVQRLLEVVRAKAENAPRLASRRHQTGS